MRLKPKRSKLEANLEKKYNRLATGYFIEKDRKKRLIARTAHTHQLFHAAPGYLYANAADTRTHAHAHTYAYTHTHIYHGYKGG